MHSIEAFNKKNIIQLGFVVCEILIKFVSDSINLFIIFKLVYCKIFVRGQSRTFIHCS